MGWSKMRLRHLRTLRSITCSIVRSMKVVVHRGICSMRDDSRGCQWTQLTVRVVMHTMQSKNRCPSLVYQCQLVPLHLRLLRLLLWSIRPAL